MRTLRLIGIALVAVLIGINLTACSDDDDDNKDDEPLTNPISGTINGHDYVDLGLSVKWATCNVGANSPYDYGDYFAWGETETKSDYSDNNSVTYGKEMGSIAGNPEYDAATAHWGSPWRMPTKEEIDELVSKCTWELSIQEEYEGQTAIGPNGNSIFFPSAGYHFETSYFLSHEGYYWSATPYEEDTLFAYILRFGWGAPNTELWIRSNGYTVRPVTE